MRHLMTTASLAVLCLCASTPALAHDPDPGDPGDPVRLEEVIVTATRLPQPEGETPGARVFTEADIEARGAIFAADLLAEVPGAALARTGPFGGLTQLRLRGASPGKTLVLIDGVPVNDPAEINGAYDFSS
ncbi:MAG TPA: TonB-dependent receptor, partial [Brevundimonas sp.]|nr:TonB-dependent receptor [Brevundimonas sp.]